MKFNSKRISGFLIFTSTIILAACGGEGSDQNTHEQAENNLEKEDKIYQVYYQPANISSEIYSDSFEITQYSIKNNEIFFSNSHNQPLEKEIFTEEKILNRGTLQTNIVKRLTPSSWTYELTPDLKQNLNFEIVKLDGEKIFDRVLPGYRENINFNVDQNSYPNQNLIKFYQNYNSATFPKNSYCYRLKETQWNKPYINYISTFANRSFIQEREKIIKDYEGINLFDNKADYHLESGKWHGFDWIFLLSNKNIINTFGLVGNSENQTANAVLVQSALWNVDQSVEYERNWLKKFEESSSDNPIKEKLIFNQKLDIANLEKGCFAFNTQAVQAIQELNLVNWKQGDSSVIGPFFGRRTFVYDINEAE